MIGAVLAAGLAGCDGAVMATEPDLGATSSCVVLPEGTYQFADGMFIPASGIPEDWDEQEEPETAPPSRQWSVSVEERLQQDGYDWLTVRARGSIAFVEGTSPDQDTKVAALDAARSAIEEERQASDTGIIVLDNIDVDEAPAPMGAPVASLPPAPSLAACDAAFSGVLDGRTLEFSANNEAIGDDSLPIADALTGVALICDRYRIEVGGHTDARGAESFNERLSQTRANTLRDYLVERGVRADALSAVGYGESQPIDTSQTTEAYARNRRVEFTLSNNESSRGD